ncbi:MAG: hypothetical protein QM730_23185 [Anaerolineales bacterium]
MVSTFLPRVANNNVLAAFLPNPSSSLYTQEHGSHQERHPHFLRKDLEE